MHTKLSHKNGLDRVTMKIKIINFSNNNKIVVLSANIKLHY